MIGVSVRKRVFHQETVLSEMGREAERPITRVAGVAVFTNPCAGRWEADLSPLFDIGAEIGELLTERVVSLVEGSVVSYGKAAVVGVNGDFEHGGALLHPKLGRPMRAAIGGGEALIPSNVKVAPAGSAIDVPLGHKDDPWSFDHFDTMGVAISDAPRPDEICLVVAMADGGRVNPRCGAGRVL